MGFRLLIICTGPSETHLNEHQAEEWPRRLAQLVPDIQIDSCHSVEEAMDVIGEADAAFGEVIPELFQRANRLQWVQSPRAAPKGACTSTYHSSSGASGSPARRSSTCPRLPRSSWGSGQSAAKSRGCARSSA